MAFEKKTAATEKVEKKKVTEEELAKARAIVTLAEQEQAEAEKKAAEEARAPKHFKPGVWVCTEDCYHNGQLFRAGQKVEWKKPSEAPVVDGYVRHFQPEG